MKPHAKKFYRLVIYSANVLSTPTPAGYTAWYDGFYQIDFPEILNHDKYQVAVESFNMNRSGANATNGFIVHCSDLSQANSYSTLTQSTSTTLLNYNGNSFYRFLDFGSIGIPVKDVSFMRNNPLRIYLSTLDGVPITNNDYFGVGGTQWVMSLIIYPIDTDEYAI